MTDKYLDPSNLQRVWASITSRLGGKADQADMDAAETAIGSHAASIATVEQATATANHAVGDYFMVGNVLMRAMSAIASGEQITSSNATPATVQGQIDSLRQSVSLLKSVAVNMGSRVVAMYFGDDSGNDAFRLYFFASGTVRMDEYANGQWSTLWTK